MKPHAAVDFESFYDKKTLSASTHGPWKYLHSTDIYLVSIVTEDGFEWVGDPKQAPWDRIAGHTWVSHNRSFDATAAKAIGIDHPDWHCSADLCAYFQYPRSLAGATAALYNEVVSKQVRDEMDGVRWVDVADKQAVLDYALIDSRKCLRLWLDHGPKWPEKERALSQHTTQMGHRGIGLDLPLLAAGIETLRQQLHEIRKSIPWEGKPTSPKELAAECRRIGIEPPVTTAVKDSRFDAWLRENEEKAPFVRGISLYRSTNRLLNGLETMDRFRDGDRLRVPLRYCGAPHTGRWSGKASDRDDDASFNLQNLLKKDLFGVNQRHILVPRPGHSFITLDLAQIEPRCCEEGTLILTDRGYVPIEDVTRIDKVWDGVEWCAHDGVVEKPGAATSRIGQCRFTDDHLILTSRGWVPAEAVSETDAMDTRNPSWKDIWKLACAVGRRVASTTCSMLGLRT